MEGEKHSSKEGEEDNRQKYIRKQGKKEKIN
jgi:hypothetical protein